MRCHYPEVRASWQHIFFPGCYTVTSLACSAAAHNQGSTSTQIINVTALQATSTSPEGSRQKTNECSKNIRWGHVMLSIHERVGQSVEILPQLSQPTHR